MLCEDKTTSHGFIWPGLIHISAHLVSVVVDIVQRHVHVLHVHPPKAQFNFPMSTIQRESEPDWNSSWKMSYILLIQIKFQSMFMQDDPGCSLRLISPINKAIKLHTSIVSLYPPPLLLNTFPLCSCEPPPKCHQSLQISAVFSNSSATTMSLVSARDFMDLFIVQGRHPAIKSYLSLKASVKPDQFLYQFNQPLPYSLSLMFPD